MSAVQKLEIKTPVIAIGQAYGGGFFSGITQEGDKRYINITAGAQHELVGAWGPRSQSVEGANGYSDSRSNTEAMAAAGSELAQKVLALNIGGFNDWGIPARDVQELQYRHLKPTTDENYCTWRDGDNPSSVPPGYPYTEASPAQTTVEAFRDGGPEAFQGVWYWSSSQRSADGAYYMDFDDGGQGNFGKILSARVRPVRRELIID